MTCLSWGEYGAGHVDRQEANRKRKRAIHVNGDTLNGVTGDLALAYGTSDSDIHIYSPAAAKIVGLLTGGHTQGVRDFKFALPCAGREGWSIGGDAQAVQWDLKTSRPLRTIPLPYGPVSTICPLGSSIICASHQAYILDPNSESPPAKYNVATRSVHSISTRSSSSTSRRSFLAAAENENSISVFEEGSETLIGSLRAGNEVLNMDYQGASDTIVGSSKGRTLSDHPIHQEEALAIVNRDGVLELFPEPFDFGGGELHKDSESTKAKMQRRSRKSAAQFKITRQDSFKSIIPLINACFRGDQLVLAWVEGGVNIVFDMVKWRDGDSGILLMKGDMEISRGKGSTVVGAMTVNGIKNTDKSQVDESHVVVANGIGADEMSVDDQPPEVIDISSGEAESEDSDMEDASGPSPSTLSTTVPEKNEPRQSLDSDMHDSKEPREGDVSKRGLELTEEPTFGDLLKATAPETVDVQAPFVDPNAHSLVPSTDKSLRQLPSGMSLGTVLTQSLRTNDNNLLEICFHVRDLSTVRATIERLDSSSASTLLERLAERLHSRPGRAGSLMVWVQWTVISHGGYLVGVPDLMKKLVSLYRVVQERADSLQSLLSLKGKLDMLEAQMNLRKNMQASSRINDEVDDAAIIYVEGQDESDSEQGADEATQPSDVKESAAFKAAGGARTTTSSSLGDPPGTGMDADLGEEMPIDDNQRMDSEDEESGSEENMVDDEASSTEGSGDELISEETDHDDIESDSSDADMSPPPKRPAKPHGPTQKT